MWRWGASCRWCELIRLTMTSHTGHGFTRMPTSCQGLSLLGWGGKGAWKMIPTFKQWKQLKMTLFFQLHMDFGIFLIWNYTACAQNGQVVSRVARFSEPNATTNPWYTDRSLLFNNFCFNILKVYQYLKLGCIDSSYITECMIYDMPQ